MMDIENARIQREQQFGYTKQPLISKYPATVSVFPIFGGKAPVVQL